MKSLAVPRRGRHRSKGGESTDCRLGSLPDELLRVDDPERDLHRAAAARVAGRLRGLGARGRGEARRGRVRLHRGRRGGRGDDAREPRRLPPLAPAAADAGRERAARHLGRGARPALAGTVLPRSGRRALDRPRGGRGRRRQGGGLLRRADGPVERGDALDRRGRGDERAALVPALLGERPRDLRELRPPGRGERLRRDRRHARHADARLAAARPAPGIPAVHSRRRAAASTSAIPSSSRSSTRRPRRIR